MNFNMVFTYFTLAYNLYTVNIQLLSTTVQGNQTVERSVQVSNCFNNYYEHETTAH